MGDVDKTPVRVNGTPMTERGLATHRRLLGPKPIVAVQIYRQRSRIRDALDRPSVVRFVTDGDVPPLVPDWVARLCEALEPAIDAVVPRCGGRPEPLHARYRREAVLGAVSQLDGGPPLRSVLDEPDSVRYVTAGPGSTLSRSTGTVTTPDRLP